MPPEIQVPINTPIIARIKIACIVLPIDSTIPSSISFHVKPNVNIAIAAATIAPIIIGI
ncbi:hypothetical protein SDC9_52328 [bioreactor metagenome]|uniref:Uncharacterized protein n=1 Tax=bioreactor metagenome TaxID=1076179 RepID=A0A644WVC8_9ZZZZ